MKNELVFGFSLNVYSKLEKCHEAAYVSVVARFLCSRVWQQLKQNFFIVSYRRFFLSGQLSFSFWPLATKV